MAVGSEEEGVEPTWRSVEQFDPSLNSWGRVAPMLSERAFFGMANLDGMCDVANLDLLVATCVA